MYILCTAEPPSAFMFVNRRVVAAVDTNPLYADHNIEGAQVVVNLEQSYPIMCSVVGGNPPPSVSLSSGVLPNAMYQDVVITRSTMRDPTDRLSEPLHVTNASMIWKATIKNIGMPFNCMAGLENPAALSTNFVPVLNDSK